MRVAALYDIHGNLPALIAVLAEVAETAVDVVVIGGDVVTGPMPRETLEHLAGLSVPIAYLRGNADREAVAAFDQGRINVAAESDPIEQEAAFTAARLTPSQRDLLADLPMTLELEIDGLGDILFCHGSPRSDSEILTSATSAERLSAVLSDVEARTIVGGHTHRQYDRTVGGRRFINAGSVGRPYEGRSGAFWTLLADGISLRRTDYDIDQAVAVLRRTDYPDLDGMLRESLTEPVDPDQVASWFETLATSA